MIKRLFAIFLLVISMASCSGLCFDETLGDTSVIITNGVPFYVNGSVSYYLYNGIRYYPRYFDGYYHFYRRPMPIPPRPMYDNRSFRPQGGGRPDVGGGRRPNGRR